MTEPVRTPVSITLDETTLDALASSLHDAMCHHEGSFRECRRAVDRLATSPVFVGLLTEQRAIGWDERGTARPVYLGPDGGHYNDDCGGWSDCHCGTFVNPYRPVQ